MEIQNQVPNDDSSPFKKFKNKILALLGVDNTRMSKSDMEKAIGEETVEKILAQKKENVWIIGLIYTFFTILIHITQLSKWVKNGDYVIIGELVALVIVNVVCLILYRKGKHPNSINYMVHASFLYSSCSTLTFHQRFPDDNMFRASLFIMIRSQ